jgi:myo-inositol-1(or 4)-monophosphatase
MELERILEKTIDLAKKTGEFIKNEQNKLKVENIESKGIHNFVTYVDKTAEQRIVNGLLEILPESGFITEEETIDKKGERFTWIVDPLDGTTNYIHGLSPVAVSIALQENNETILGVVYEISNAECFYAIKGKPAFLNGKKIHVSNINKLNDSLLATGFPYYDYNRLLQFMKSLEFLMQNSHGIRRLGSAATDLAYVACGRFEGFYEYGLSPWDVAAGAFIVERAGGKVADFNGKDNYIFGKEIISANSDIFAEFLLNINNIMKSNI